MKAIRFPTGDQIGNRAGGPSATTADFRPDSRSKTYGAPSRGEMATRRPSGLREKWSKYVLEASTFLDSQDDASRVHNSCPSTPFRTKSSRRPSGNHAGRQSIVLLHVARDA